MTADWPSPTPPTASHGRRARRPRGLCPPATPRTTTTPTWPTTTPGGSSSQSPRWSSESSPSSPARRPRQCWVTTRTRGWPCPTRRATTRRTRWRASPSGPRGWRDSPAEWRPGPAVSGDDVPATSRLSPSELWADQAECRARWELWTGRTWLRRNCQRLPAVAGWFLSSRATCTRSPRRASTRGSTWPSAVTACWPTTPPSKPTLRMLRGRRSSWATSPSKYPARSRPAWRLAARGQQWVRSRAVTRRTWLWNSVSQTWSRSTTARRRRGTRGRDFPLSRSQPGPTSSWSPWTARCGSSRWAPWRRWRTGRRQSRARSSTRCAAGRFSTWTTSGTTSPATRSVRTAAPAVLTGPLSTSAYWSVSSAPASTGISGPTSPKSGHSAWTVGVRWTSKLWRTSGTARPTSSGREIYRRGWNRTPSLPEKPKSTSSSQNTAWSHSALSTTLIWARKTPLGLWFKHLSSWNESKTLW